MIFYMLIGLCLAYEIHKLFDFRNFSKLYLMIVKYSKEIKNRKIGKFSTAILKISFFNLFYYILLLIGLFGKNGVFFGSLLILSFITEKLIKSTKPKTATIIFLIDAIISIIVLSLACVNFLFFKMKSLEFINYLISLV